MDCIIVPGSTSGQCQVSEQQTLTGSSANSASTLTLCVRVCAALFHHFKDPIMITEGKMQYLYDDKGRRYLDVRTLLHPCFQFGDLNEH